MFKPFRFLKPYWWQVAILLVATSGQVFATLQIPALMADIINNENAVESPEVNVSSEIEIRRAKLENLIENAIKYTTDVDRIKVAVKNGKLTVSNPCDRISEYDIENNNIVFYEIPYGVATEELMNEIGAAADGGKINGIKNIRNESNRKKGFRLVIECDKGASIATIINLLFKETNLQTSFSYNQVALIDKTPTELNLKQCIEIYLNHNKECLVKELNFDLTKAKARLEIVNGLLKALEDIDNIIALIKASASAAAAKTALMEKYSFTEPQAKAIVDMKLGKLASLEKIELNQEAKDLANNIEEMKIILADEQRQKDTEGTI